MDLIIIFNLDKKISFFYTKGENFRKKNISIKTIDGVWKTAFSKYKLTNGKFLVFVWKTFIDEEQFLEIGSLNEENKLRIHAKWSFKNGEIMEHKMGMTNVGVKYRIISEKYGNWSNFSNIMEHRDDEGKWENDPRNGIGYVY